MNTIYSAPPVLPASILRQALVWLAARSSFDFQEEPVEQALSEAMHHPVCLAQPLEALRYVSGVAGLSLTGRHFPLQEVIKYLRQGTPLLMVCEPQPGKQLLIALTGFRWFRFQITVFGEQGSVTRWIPKQQLKLYLGAVLLDESIYCLMLQSPSVNAQRETPLHLTPTQHLQKLIKLERADLLVVVIYSILTGLLSLVVPIAIQALVNNVAFGTLLQPIVILTCLVLGALCFLALLRTLRLNLVEIIQRRIFVRVASDLSERLLQVKLPFFEGHHGPELVNRFFDVLTVQKGVSVLLIEGLGILLQIFTGMLLLAFYHPFLLVFDIVLLLAIIVILFVLGWGAEATAIKESKLKYAVAAWLEELSSHLTLFRSRPGKHYAQQRTDALLRGYLKARQRHFRVVQRQHVGAYLLQALASAALLGLGGWLVIERQLSIGQLVAAELVVANLLDGFSKFGKKLETYYDLLAALDKLGHLFDIPVEARSPGLLMPREIGLDVQIENLNLSAPGGRVLLKQLSLHLQPGEKIGILGANSWSAHVLGDLLYASRYPDQGSIAMDQRNLREISPLDLRSQVALVRGLDILSGSLDDNLRLGQRHLRSEDLRAVLESVGLWERVQAFPEGLNTPLSLSGYPLSPEEAHRLMVARALLLKPRLLILDGSLDRIDWREKGPLARFLFGQHPEMSLLVLTNKPDFLTYCDRAYALDSEGSLLLFPLPSPLNQEGKH
jgi:putative ABC transport system ATP-binding protein